MSATAETAVPEQKSVFRDYAETILICVIFVVFSRAFVFQQSKIPSGSMKDTLLIGDYIMVNRFVYSPSPSALERALLPVRPVRRGDVVVFKKPQEPEQDYIKRVIGLEGDTVQLRNGFLFVNGAPVDEPYVREDYRRRDSNRNYGPVTVQPGHMLVMGDHRNRSSDSRDWGQVSLDLLKGRALLIWWSYEECDEELDPDCKRVKVYNVTLRERLQSWGSKILHFATKSRWSRCFNLIR